MIALAIIVGLAVFTVISIRGFRRRDARLLRQYGCTDQHFKEAKVFDPSEHIGEVTLDDEDNAGNL